MRSATSHPVYVIDDDDGMRESAQFLMKTLAIECRCFVDARQFLAELDALRPGLILTDLHLPGLSGIDLKRELETRNVKWPVILMTSDHERQIAKSDGFATTLRKPFAVKELLHAIEQVRPRLP